jgi:hypothetical protein
MREVTIISNTAHTMEKFNSSATTWGELCEEHSKIEDMSAGLKVVEKSTKAILGRDTNLPPVNFTVYLYPAKVEAGI